MKQTIYIVLAVIVILGVIVGGYALTQQSTGTILGAQEDTKSDETTVPKTTIGVIVPESGSFAPLGTEVKQAIALSLETAELDFVSLVTIDSECQEEKASAAVETLVNEHNVIAIIGGVCGDPAVAMAQKAQELGVPLVSPGATAAILSELTPYVFRTMPSNAQQGAWSAALMYEQGFRKVGLITEDSSPNNEFALGFTTAFTNVGGAVVTHETYEPDAESLRPEVGEIFAYRPDAAMLVSSDPQSALKLLNEFKRQGPNLPIFGSGSFATEEFISAAGPKANGITNATVSLGVLTFAQQYLTSFETLPGPMAAHAYDAFVAIALTLINDAESRDEVAALLPQTKFDGASGYVEFNEQGDVPGNYTIFTIQDEALVQIDRTGAPIPIPEPEAAPPVEPTTEVIEEIDETEEEELPDDALDEETLPEDSAEEEPTETE